VNRDAKKYRDGYRIALRTILPGESEMFHKHSKRGLEIVEVEVDAYDLAILVDALAVWEADGCPTNNPMLDQHPPTNKRVEDLRWRLYGADKVVTRTRRVEYDGRKPDEH
jgi:hypothetical protein